MLASFMALRSAFYFINWLASHQQLPSYGGGIDQFDVPGEFASCIALFTVARYPVNFYNVETHSKFDMSLFILLLMNLYTGFSAVTSFFGE